VEVEAEIMDTDDVWGVADAGNPLRLPGESSPKPARLREEDHKTARGISAPGKR
jgi:hypothetical protein